MRKRTQAPADVQTSAPTTAELGASPNKQPSWTMLQVMTETGKGQRFERNKFGAINNCSMHNEGAAHEKECQVCDGICPARNMPEYVLPVTKETSAMVGGVAARERARAQVLAVSAVGGPGQLTADDLLEVTIGAEKFRGYDVGPVVVRGRMKQGESLLDAYTRIRSAAAALFELELAERMMDHTVIRGPETYAKEIEDYL